MNESMNDEAVYRTAPATTGLLNTLKFKMVHVSGAKNFLADRGWRFPTGAAGADKAEKGAESTERSGNEWRKCLPMGQIARHLMRTS